MKMPKYVLCAVGTIVLPGIDIIAPAYDEIDDVLDWCKTTAQNLFAAGYHTFTLYLVGENDVYIDTFRVEATKPFVWRKNED